MSLILAYIVEISKRTNGRTVVGENGRPRTVARCETPNANAPRWLVANGHPFHLVHIISIKVYAGGANVPPQPRPIGNVGGFAEMLANLLGTGDPPAGRAGRGRSPLRLAGLRKCWQIYWGRATEDIPPYKKALLTQYFQQNRQIFQRIIKIKILHPIHKNRGLRHFFQILHYV